MHVIHYVPNYDSPVGGREIFVGNLVKHLNELRVNQTVVTYSYQKSQQEEVPSDDTPVIYLKVKKIGAYPLLFGLMPVLRSKRYDIIHIHGYGEYAGDLSCLLKRFGLLRSPLILTTHGISGLKNAFLAMDRRTGFTMGQRLKRGIHLVYDHLEGRLVLGAFDRVILLSDEEKQYLSRITTITSRYMKMPIAVSDIFFDPKYANPDRKTILYAGRIDPYKGLGTLMHALGELRDKIPDLKCIIIGKDFGYRRQLEKLIGDLGLQAVVCIREFVCQDELVKYYNSSLVTVLPSMSEGFPLVLVESMTTGTPFISTPVGAVPELVESSKAGLLVEVGDSKSLADAILRLSKDRNLWEELSTNGRRSSQNYTWTKLATSYYQLYQELLDASHQD